MENGHHPIPHLPLTISYYPPRNHKSEYRMPKSSFQEIILKLQDFWAAHGCLITQPYYTQVGAGTMNPNTFLRVLGPDHSQARSRGRRYAGGPA